MESDELVDFGGAIHHLKSNGRVARKGWNGKGMFLVLVRGWWIEEDHPNFDTVGECEGSDWIGMKTADDKFIPWLASQADMLAVDWELL